MARGLAARAGGAGDRRYQAARLVGSRVRRHAAAASGRGGAGDPVAGGARRADCHARVVLVAPRARSVGQGGADHAAEQEQLHSLHRYVVLRRWQSEPRAGQAGSVSEA